MENKHGFFEQVYDIVKLIPRGKVTTYGAIARYLGLHGSARMVGWAMNKVSLDKTYIPAHRVVNRNGLLTGKHYFGSENTMKQLLESEGIKVIDDKIVDFENHLWIPEEHLS